VSIRDILKNTAGEFEVGRTLLTTAAASAITTPVVFKAIDLAHNGWHFDETSWCLAYPGGIAALVTCGVLSIGNKDKNVAVARQTAAQPPLSDTSTESKS
jgi:hypothetical protein